MTESPNSVHGMTLTGINPAHIDVQAVSSPGRAPITVFGLSTNRARALSTLVEQALHASGEPLPSSPVTLGVLPMSLDKHAPLDLAVAVAALVAGQRVPAPDHTWRFIGGLTPKAETVPMRGVLRCVRAATAAGCTHVVVPAANAPEAALVEGITVLGAWTLSEVITWLREGSPARSRVPMQGAWAPGRPAAHQPPAAVDTQLSAAVRRALEVAAAGRHHVLVTGRAPGDADRVAALLPALLPDLGPDAALDVTELYSLAGQLDPIAPLITRPPAQNSEPNTSPRIMFGSGQLHALRPGLVSLAHHGVLQLDNVHQFSAAVIRDLAPVLMNHQVTLHRARTPVSLPAQFLLAMTAPVCPCERPLHRCTCTAGQAAEFRARLSRLLTPHIPLRIDLPDISAERGEVDVPSAERVARARRRTSQRLTGTGWLTSSDVPRDELHQRYAPTPEAIDLLRARYEAGGVSSQELDQALRIAWTLTDLDGEIDRPGLQELTDALAMTGLGAPATH